MTTASIGIISFIAGIAGSMTAHRHPAFGVWWDGCLTIACTVLTVLSAIQREWGWAAALAVLAVLNGLLWNHSRRKRKRRNALALAGAKSRARIQAIVAKHRAAQRRTRPVLRPARGSAA